MKILLINHFPLAGSGSGTYTRNLAVHLTELGHEICIIFPENTDDISEVPGVKLHPVFFASNSPQSQDASATDNSQPLGSSISKPVPFNFPCFTTHPRSTMTFGDLNDAQLTQYTQAFSSAINEEMERFAPDVVHGQHVWILPSLACDYGIPLVLTAHGTDLMGYAKWPHLRHYAKRAMRASSAVITISKDNRELLLKEFPDQADKVVMMRNGFDPFVFHELTVSREDVLGAYDIDAAEKDRAMVFFAGKLTRFKGVDVLLDAVAQYEKHMRDETGSIPLTVLAGDGEERANLTAQAQRLGLSGVHFLGNVSQQELCRLYSITDVSVVPSRREPFGLVAIEAMACGAPVIASNEGGLPDFVNDNVGALVTPENPTELACAIMRTLERARADREGSWRHAIATYAREHYAQDKIIEELAGLYRRALEADYSPQ